MERDVLHEMENTLPNLKLINNLVTFPHCLPWRICRLHMSVVQLQITKAKSTLKNRFSKSGRQVQEEKVA